MTPTKTDHLVETRTLDELPQPPKYRHIKTSDTDIYIFRSESSAERFINSNAHKDVRIEILARDENSDAYIRFLSNPGEYHTRGASISYVQDAMHEYQTLSDFLKHVAPIDGLDEAKFDYFQVQVRETERKGEDGKGHIWGRNRS